ncbi:MAG: hypothetical protein J6T23_06075 [Elusimicrobia bacterium]|nr:hypothetical protein [Elusimicrobiota bacterium]
MTPFDKIELTFIIIEAIAIIIEIGLEIYSIKSSKDSEKKILNKLKK